MDFTLSLAHFCELHGPTSVLCTQVLPSCCTLCRPFPSSNSSPKESPSERTSYFPPQSKAWRNAGYVAKDMDRCASCRMTIPDDTFYDPSPAVDKNRPPIRTKEEIHICGDADSDSDDSSEEHNPFPSPSPSPSPDPYAHHASPCPSSSSCHTHSLEYVTAPSPAEIDMFSKLRTSILRAFTGEELPRGQQAGPFWFGSSGTGYTIGYKFVLADEFARGTRRTYALLALAGYDIQRALAAATVLWALFEQIALNIIRAAQEVNARTHPEEDSTPPEDEMEEMMRRPVSGFLSARGGMSGLGRMMHDRRGAGVDQKPTSIAELVENERFFCELHMVFVGILQELGRTFGGMQVKAPDEEESGVGELGQATVTADEGEKFESRAENRRGNSNCEWTEGSRAYPPTPNSFDGHGHGHSAMRESGIMTSRQVAV